FQAEDGIRDFHVTGVQTCALPIWSHSRLAPASTRSRSDWLAQVPGSSSGLPGCLARYHFAAPGEVSSARAPARAVTSIRRSSLRSEERRVGKERRARWSRVQYK